MGLGFEFHLDFWTWSGVRMDDVQAGYVRLVGVRLVRLVTFWAGVWLLIVGSNTVEIPNAMVFSYSVSKNATNSAFISSRVLVSRILLSASE